MGMSLHIDVVETLIFDVFLNPQSIFLGVHLNRCAGYLLRIDNDVIDDILVKRFIFSSTCDTCLLYTSDAADE